MLNQNDIFQIADTQQQNPLLNMEFVAAVQVLSKCYARVFNEYQRITAHQSLGAKAIEAQAVLIDFFLTMKMDSSIFNINDASSIARLKVAYLDNPEYGPLLKRTTMELMTVLGVANIDKLAKNLGESFVRSGIHSGQDHQASISEIVRTFTNNPWYVTLIISFYTEVPGTEVND